MDKKKIAEIFEKNKKRFKTNKDHINFLNLQIQEHLVELDDLREQNNPHLTSEAMDLAILSCMVAIAEGADDKVFDQRVKRFFEKIEEKPQKKEIEQKKVEETNEEEIEVVRL